MRSARLLADDFEPREGFEPRGLRDARPVQIWYSPEVARWRLERGTARRLKDGSAIEEVAVGGEDWLIGEILSFRGEAVVREPKELRARIADRARKLQAELGLTRVRVPSAR
jgi:predicted DNA-binding transcriptional regulator YafY